MLVDGTRHSMDLEDVLYITDREEVLLDETDWMPDDLQHSVSDNVGLIVRLHLMTLNSLCYR